MKRARPERRARFCLRLTGLYKTELRRRAHETSMESARRRTGSMRGRHALGPPSPELAGLPPSAFGSVLAAAPAWAQPPQPFIPETSERSGLADAIRGTPEFLPPDPYRDFFYNTRYADTGLVTHPNWFKTQGLYGLGMKTPDTQSVYPFFYGMPGQGTIDSSSRPWWRPARFFQGLAQPWRPSGCITNLARTCRSTISTRSRRARAVPVSVLLQLGARRLCESAA